MRRFTFTMSKLHSFDMHENMMVTFGTNVIQCLNFKVTSSKLTWLELGGVGTDT